LPKYQPDEHKPKALPHTNWLNTSLKTLPNYQYAEPKPKTLPQYQPREYKPKMLGYEVITNDPDITEQAEVSCWKHKY
jgi:hypothetical protein